MRTPAIDINQLLTVSKEPRRYELVMLQQPEVARCSPLYDKDRRPVDPPPILQLQIYDKNGRLDDKWVTCFQRDEDATDKNLCSALRWPYWVLHTSLATHTPSERPLQQSEILQGLLTSSAHYCANGDANSSGCFFYFSDLSFAALGIYQLKFTLISVLGLPIAPTELPVLAETISQPIRVYAPKDFPGMAQSTPLAKSLAERGLIIPIRNEDHRMRSDRI